MCVLLCGLYDPLPTVSDLANCVANNPDGSGWALLWEFDGVRTLEVGRDLDGLRAGDDFLAAGGAGRGDLVAWLWHSRIATHGDMTGEGLRYNLHPFHVEGGAVLAHNGMLPTYQKKHDPRSDTRHFVEVVLNGMGGAKALSIPEVAEMVGDWATGSKMVLLNSDTTLDPVVIVNEGEGHRTSAGWWASNRSYAYRLNSDPRYYSCGTGYDTYPPAGGGVMVECPSCLVSTHADEATCDFCGCCLYCKEWYEACACEFDEVPF